MLRWRRANAPTRHLWIANSGHDAEALTAVIQQCTDGAALCTLDQAGPIFYATIEQADGAGLEGAAAEQREDAAVALAVQIIDKLNGVDQPLLGGRAPRLACSELCVSETSNVVIPGLSFTEEAVTPDEEATMIAAIDNAVWLTHIKRRVQHYGFEFNYQTRSYEPSELGPLPAWCDAMLQLLRERGMDPPDQLTVNEYTPGIGIAPHIDTHSAFEEQLVSISLGAPVVMNFKNELDGSQKQLLLTARSLLLLTGESRYAWRHGIAARKLDRWGGALHQRGRRISLTFRRLRRGGCCCAWPGQCDSQTRDDSHLKLHTLKQGAVLQEQQQGEQRNQQMEQQVEQHDAATAEGLHGADGEAVCTNEDPPASDAFIGDHK